MQFTAQPLECRTEPLDVLVGGGTDGEHDGSLRMIMFRGRGEHRIIAARHHMHPVGWTPHTAQQFATDERGVRSHGAYRADRKTKPQCFKNRLAHTTASYPSQIVDRHDGRRTKRRRHVENIPGDVRHKAILTQTPRP